MKKHPHSHHHHHHRHLHHTIATTTTTTTTTLARKLHCDGERVDGGSLLDVGLANLKGYNPGLTGSVNGDLNCPSNGHRW